MQIRIRSTGQVMFESEFRTHLQQTQATTYDTLTPETAEELGVDVVFEGPQATGGTVYQYSMRQGVEQQSDGKWYTKYVLGPIFTDNEDSTAAEQEAEYQAQKDAEQAANVRQQRTEKLKDSDWTQITDSTADKQAWATYRQALRDVTAQSGFPWTINWPTQPE